MRRIVIGAIVVLGLAKTALALQWPFTNSTGPHAITAVLGEYRDTGSAPHFHDGVDITTAPTSAGTNVRSVSVGSVVSFCTTCGDENFVAVQSAQAIFIYAHMDPDGTIAQGLPISLNQLVGSVSPLYAPPHLHFKMTNPAGTQLLNALLPPTAGLNNYVDTVWPQVISLALFNADTGAAVSSYTRVTRLDVRAKAKDSQSLGSGNVGIFSVGYRVRNLTTGQTVIPAAIKQGYDVIPVANIYIPDYAYDTSVSDLSNYYYFANNLVVSPTPIDLTNQPDGTYEICVFVKDIKGNGGDIANQRGAACKNAVIDNTSPSTPTFTAGGTPFLTATSTPVVTIEASDPNGIYSITVEGVGYSSTAYITGFQTSVSIQFPTSGTLANGTYTVTVCDMAGNCRSTFIIVSAASSNLSAEILNEKGEVITSVIPSTRCIVVHATDIATGVESINISGASLSKTMTYPCGVPAVSTDVYAGAFCNLTANSTYTAIVTNCAETRLAPPQVTVAPATNSGSICVAAPAGPFCSGDSPISDAQLQTYALGMRVCMSANCANCTEDKDGLTFVPTPAGGSMECASNVCCRRVHWALPLASQSFSVTNTTNVSSGDRGWYYLMLTTNSSQDDLTSIDMVSPNFLMTPGQTTVGTIDISQIGQGYQTTSPDGVAKVNSPFTRLHFSLTQILSFLAKLATQLLRVSTPYIYNYLGSDAVFNSTTTLTFTYADTVNTDTTTLRIYMFDGVSWSSAAIINQTVSYSTTTHVITASGDIDRTGLYATQYQAVDSSSPITTLTIQGSTHSFDGALFVSTDTYLVLTATDPVVNGFASTVASVTYRIDPSSGSAFSIYTSSIPLSLGTHVFEYRSLDYAGNIETTKTSTFTVTAGTAMRASSTAKVAGNLLNGFLGSGAKLEIVSQAQNSLTLLVSSVNRQGMVAVDNIGEVGAGITAPQAGLDIGAGAIALQLRSGNSTASVTSAQIAFGYNGDDSMRHMLRTEHSTATAGNKMDFLLWNTAAASTVTLGNLPILTLQAIATASSGSFHVRPYGEPDAEVEVSNGLATGAGTIQYGTWDTPSSRRFKTDITDLSAKDEALALADVIGLKHARFRYKSHSTDGRLVDDPTQPLKTGLIYEEAPASVRGDDGTISTVARLANVEMALKASMRRLEELEDKYARLKARSKAR